MKHKAQAGLEYLMTYGWALILVVTVVTVLVFVVLTPSSQVVFSSSDPTKILMKAGAFTGESIEVRLQNITGGKITITGIAEGEGYSGCRIDGETPSGGNPVEVMAGGEMTLECTAPPSGSGRIAINYTDFAGLQRSVGISGRGTASAPSGLVAHYKFDEGSGTTTADSSGNQNHGTLGGNPTWETSNCPSSEKCLGFDGGDDYVNVGNGDSLNDIRVKTISIWIKPESFGTEIGGIKYITLLSKLDYSGEPYPGWNIIAIESRPLISEPTRYETLLFQVDFESQDSGMGKTIAWMASDYLIKLDEWQHIVLVYDNSNWQNEAILYYNGGKVNMDMVTWDDVRIPGGPVLSDAGVELTIGKRIGGRFFDGKIDEVKVFGRPLTTFEVCDLCKEHADAVLVTCSC